MAQLTDDCFAFDGPLISTDAALSLIAARAEPVAGIEEIALSNALGRVLAEPVVAAHAVPPYDNSAVDGFAIYADDLSTEIDTVLPIRGRVAAGHPLGRPQARGEAVRIFTGAPMPAGPGGGPGPDTVMMLEDCETTGDGPDGERVRLRPGIKRGANRRPAGEDVAPGAEPVAVGTRLRPPEVGMLAALGRDRIKVRTPLTVALFSTGDEVCAPGGPLPDGALYDSNRFTISAALTAIGCSVADLGILKDDAAGIRTTMRTALGRYDAVLSTGGMSMGEEDHVRAAIEALGSLTFWRIAIKPGRPVGLGLVDAGAGRRPFIGLPGNPVAALTTFIVLARPLLQTMAGETMRPPVRQRVKAGFSYRKKEGRREFVRVTVDADPDGGAPIARKHGRGGAGMLSSLVGADGFVELAEDVTRVAEGDSVPYLSFAEVLR